MTRKICSLFVGDNVLFARMKYTKALHDLNNKIIECKLVDGKWEFMRERTDKNFPNSFNTAKSVYNSIVKPVTQEILLSYIEKYRYRDDADH